MKIVPCGFPPRRFGVLQLIGDTPNAIHRLLALIGLDQRQGGGSLLGLAKFNRASQLSELFVDQELKLFEAFALLGILLEKLGQLV